MLPLDERYSRAGIEVDIDHHVRVCPPARVAGEDAAITVDLFDHCYVPQAVGPLYPRLQVDDGARAGFRRNAPPELVRAGGPLPGI